MRIIAGRYKGHSVKIPKSKLVRPTTDRNKESIFNWLKNLIDFEGISVCDLYAGSGSLGLEALSRGAGTVHFVEKNFQVYRTLVENVKKIDSEKKCKIIKHDCIRFTSSQPEIKYDLIIADPPFFKDDIYKVAANVKNFGFLKKDGIFIIERSIQTIEKDTIELGAEPIKRLGDSLIYKL